MVGRPIMATGVVWTMSASSVEGRTSLNPALIVSTAKQIATDEPLVTLTMTRLGVELGADPTAVYRHFRSRDDLLLAVTDEFYVEAALEYDPELKWDARLNKLMKGIRRSFLRRPAISVETAYRFTGGPGEQRIIELSKETLLESGMDPSWVERNTRVMGECLLGFIMGDSGWLVLDLAGRTRERQVERSTYSHQRGIIAADLSIEEAIADDWLIDQFLETFFAGLNVRSKVSQ